MLNSDPLIAETVLGPPNSVDLGEGGSEHQEVTDQACLSLESSISRYQGSASSGQDNNSSQTVICEEIPVKPDNLPTEEEPLLSVLKDSRSSISIKVARFLRARRTLILKVFKLLNRLFIPNMLFSMALIFQKFQN